LEVAATLFTAKVAVLAMDMDILIVRSSGVDARVTAMSAPRARSLVGFLRKKNKSFDSHFDLGQSQRSISISLPPASGVDFRTRPR
jgi:hypothetical protein|tara:strand:+ start:384 stop:641 length:258 start_codon:yes stop_codon:yes gene_type:complete